MAGPTVVSSEVTKFLFDYGRKQMFSVGSYIIREGQLAKNVFVILDGEAEIVKADENGNDKVVAKVGKGTILGEMGVFMNQPRTTSVRIAQDLTALEFTAESFTSAVIKLPDLSLRLLKSLSSKLSESNDVIVGLGYAQSMLMCGMYVLDTRPSQTEKETSITLSMQQIHEETGLEKQIIRNCFERFNRRGVMMGLGFQGSTISGKANYPKLTRLLKTVGYTGKERHSRPSVTKAEEKPKEPEPAKDKTQYNDEGVISKKA